MYNLDGVDLGTVTGLSALNPKPSILQGVLAKDVSLGHYFTCVILAAPHDGTVKCFGLNDQGQLGYGDTHNRVCT